MARLGPRSCAALVTAAALGLAACASNGPPAGEDGTRAVGFLLLEGVYNSELMAPYDVFQHTLYHTSPGMRVFTIGRTLAPVRSFEGLTLVPDYTLDTAPELDVLVVPSAEHNMDSDLEDRRLLSWLSERGSRCEWVLSVCDGAFLLAAAGLLDGKRCTTFPGDIAALRERFPELDVVEKVSFVADAPALTGAGGARSYEPALYLVEELYGNAVARGVGRGLVIDWDLTRVPHVTVSGPEPPGRSSEPP